VTLGASNYVVAFLRASSQVNSKSVDDRTTASDYEGNYDDVALGSAVAELLNTVANRSSSSCLSEIKVCAVDLGAVFDSLYFSGGGAERAAEIIDALAWQAAAGRRLVRALQEIEVMKYPATCL
jgi:hypothetical protein